MEYDGKKIRSLREGKDEGRGWSLAKLASLAKLSEPSVWALEHGVTKEPKASTMMRIAVALGVPLSDILKHSKRSDGDLLGDLTGVFDQLDSRDKQAVIAAARALLDNQGRK